MASSSADASSSRGAEGVEPREGSYPPRDKEDDDDEDDVVVASDRAWLTVVWANESEVEGVSGSIDRALPVDRPCLDLATGNDDARAVLVRSITRFLRAPDKLAALCSVLLKSRAWHQKERTTTSSSSTIVGLPRTEHNKPYVPDAVDGGPTHTLSVSHQHPVVAAARLASSSSSSRDGQRRRRPRPLRVGLDVVVIEEDRMTRETLDCFKMSFTDREWRTIVGKRTHPERLKEFLLRWSLKEAYTKALGVGMGLDFKWLEIRLEGIDEGHNDSSTSSSSSAWNRLVSSPDVSKETGTRRNGRVIQYHPNTTYIEREERWTFSFFDTTRLCEPLRETTAAALRGPPSCATVCVGPNNDDDDATTVVPVNVELLSVSDLIDWRRRD